MNTFYLVEEESGKRLRRLTPDEARSIVAVKEGRASPKAEPYFSLMQKLRRDRLRIECECRPDKPGSLLLGTRRNRDGRTFVVNLPKQDVAHAEDCVFRVERPPMPPIVHSDVFKLISRADADRGDIDPDFPVHRKSRGLSQGQRPRTMRGILWTLMHTARLHRLAVADGFSSSRGWLAAIEQAAEQFYLPPGSPGVGVPVHRPQELELGRSRETAGRRRPGLARVRRALCPSLLARPRRERIRGQRQEHGVGSHESAHPGGPSDHRRQSGTRAVPVPRSRGTLGGRQAVGMHEGLCATDRRHPNARSRSIRITSGGLSDHSAPWSGILRRAGN